MKKKRKGDYKEWLVNKLSQRDDYLKKIRDANSFNSKITIITRFADYMVFEYSAKIRATVKIDGFKELSKGVYKALKKRKNI